MKRRLVNIMLIATIAIQLTGCAIDIEGLFTKTCKEPGCDETEIYADGYCKYHYFLHEGDEILKDIVNNN